jgi:hypothetical protein
MEINHSCSDSAGKGKNKNKKQHKPHQTKSTIVSQICQETFAFGKAQIQHQENVRRTLWDAVI